jgi:hypothetical protein
MPVTDGFRAAVRASSSTGWGLHGKSGSSPTPFDGVEGDRLAGPQGSHPLAAIAIEELVPRSTDGLESEITIERALAVM